MGSAGSLEASKKPLQQLFGKGEAPWATSVPHTPLALAGATSIMKLLPAWTQQERALPSRMALMVGGSRLGDGRRLREWACLAHGTLLEVLKTS